MTKIALTKKYKTYPEYKNSGVDWIGDVPRSWEFKKFKGVYASSNERVGDDRSVNQLLSVSGYRGVEEKNISSMDGQMPSEDVSAYRIVRPGQLVVNTMWLNYRGLGVSKLTGYVSPAYRAYKITKSILPSFAHYLMRSDPYVQKYSSLLYGIRPNSLQVKPNDFENIEILLPSIDEQKRIADFLDEKTVLIDRIIERKQRLIELLKEKRAAVINHSVTKGLDPKAKMVKSGLQWVGEIPNDWTRTRLGYLSKISVGSKDVNEGNPDGHYPFFTCSKEHTQSDGYSFDCEALLVAGNGEVGLTQYYKGKFEAYQRTYVLSDFGVEPLFLKYYISNLLPRALENQAIGSVISYIKRGDLMHFTVLVPTRNEQEQIVQHLDEKTCAVDAALKSVAISIETLHEFKSSLISHAVTGKIQV